jgi:hypothetical protein
VEHATVVAAADARWAVDIRNPMKISQDNCPADDSN